MRDVEYQHMAAIEDTMWWYRGLRANVLTLLTRYAAPPFVLLDAGCGTGGMLRRIRERFPASTLLGCDCSTIAGKYAVSRADAAISCASVERLPHADSSVDVIVNLDVLTADGLDGRVAMCEFARVLKPGGLLILNLAAYQWMLSYHDRAVGQSTRFSRPDACALLNDVGLHPVYASYWNTILFPLMVFRRKIIRSKNEKSDVKEIPGLVNWLFSQVMRVEAAVIKHDVALPFGGSVLIAAIKK